jgi:hypothetical protein
MPNLRTKIRAIDEVTKMSGGLKKHFAGQTLVLQGAKATADSIIATLQGYATAVKAADAARAQWTSQLAKVRVQKPRVRALLADLHALIYLTFGHNGPPLSDFGMSSRPTRKRSVASKIAAAEKSKATREVRGTMGKKQKAKVRGVAKSTP